MTWWQAVILGLVEGITEYLPVSSTGHLILASWLLGLDDSSRKSAIDAFGIVIQGGAILAVLGLYRARVAQMIRGVLGQDPAGRRLLGQILLAFLPAAMAGPFLDDAIEAHLFHATPVLFALAAGGLWMIWLDRRHGHGDAGAPVEEISWAQAFGIGCFQMVAMWPGTSRSMMTIGGGTLLGLRPAAAAEFSFLLGLPTLGSACAYKLAKNLLAAHETGTANLFEQLGVGPVALGIGVATVSAALAVNWLVGFLTRRGLTPFGWYRIALALVVGALAMAGVVRIG